ncbi:PREDICTED: HIG1 domain family member 2A-like isoform 1 [Odobenus rosmarus divergens]|uniref:HIG1 domain family member 2A-like isoform 1 n=1 Tax=Odobenus rosmarus divergens TaxID=9708 RepID=A0A9B0GM29_ODORO
MAAPGPVTPGAPFEPAQPPVIEGFSPSIYSTQESFKEKFLRKTRENPMVPIELWTLEYGRLTAGRGLRGRNVPLLTYFVPSSGCLGTAAALTYGLYCFHRGQSHRSQLMMRTRIAAQGFTVAAILLGLAASAMKSRS